MRWPNVFTFARDGIFMPQHLPPGLQGSVVDAGLRHWGTAFKMRPGIIKSIRRLKSPYFLQF